jgi:hypothetical protein
VTRSGVHRRARVRAPRDSCRGFDGRADGRAAGEHGCARRCAAYRGAASDGAHGRDHRIRGADHREPIRLRDALWRVRDAGRPRAAACVRALIIHRRRAPCRYFDTAAMGAGYGALMPSATHAVDGGGGGAAGDDGEASFVADKRSPRDFALWKAVKEGEPSWVRRCRRRPRAAPCKRVHPCPWSLSSNSMFAPAGVAVGPRPPGECTLARAATPGLVTLACAR